MAAYVPRSPVFVSAPAAYVPPRVVTNADVLSWMGSAAPSSWIVRRTGVEARHWASDDQAVSDLGFVAAETLLARHADVRQSVRQLVLATISGDYPTPPTSPLLQHRLGLTACGCVDLGASCAGFVTGLHVSAALCEAVQAPVLLVAAEIRSKFLDAHDAATAVLFGDGAAACLVSTRLAGSRFRLVASELLADGSVADAVCQEAGGSRVPAHRMATPDQAFLRMRNGPQVFALATEGMCAAASSLLTATGTRIDQVDWLVTHQANLHLVREVSRRLGVPPDRVVEVVQRYGNTSGSSVGLALDALCASGALQEGQRVLLVSAGGGGVAATALLEASEVSRPGSASG